MHIKNTPSTYTLIGANLLPLIGVLFFSWSLTEILLIFWAETAIVGFFTFWKILLSKKIDDQEVQTIQKLKESNPEKYNGLKPGKTTKFFLSVFFPVHFGGFMMGHAFFLIALFGDVGTPLQHIDMKGILFSLSTLFISHLFSFFMNYIGKKEYLLYSPQQLILQPYKRIVIMHMAVLFGGIFAEALGTPIYALIILILGKIVVDLFSHAHEHKEVNQLSIT
ncbi:MAG: hypothetical protein COU32_00430 [Candidatus Magasanikbacteria bacterium CG10_big_fil_rev_8_21_14_0_10_42_10]|uniref:Uncharacterized protein n=2 Tax=Candidatus Magasanikiibacteriota TaxID=1752731 RepID=A0A2H0TX76_9BACT|nr:MAG: hypothetical protein COU32_00430 [Candidatus Magasanikbacteria bacterium CG10_big_fil_rev_8_21_14_0_10_42_10]PIZ93588.1 MAG: hypothetical protein COX82_02375 [Candidatus Magasanikbacteria bacterium CG_4_10_14_0_2_um_filter_41_10]